MGSFPPNHRHVCSIATPPTAPATRVRAIAATQTTVNRRLAAPPPSTHERRLDTAALRQEIISGLPPRNRYGRLNFKPENSRPGAQTGAPQPARLSFLSLFPSIMLPMFLGVIDQT